MKQLHIVGSYPVGTHTFVMWQLRAALDRGHEVLVLAANEGNINGYRMAESLSLKKVHAIYSNYRKAPLLSFDLQRLAPQIQRAANSARYGRELAERRKGFFCSLLRKSNIKEVEIIQVHFVSWAIEVGLPLARLLERPCVVTAHGAITDTPTEFLREVQDQADAIVTVSDGERQAWIDKTGSDRNLVTVLNGLPLPNSLITNRSGAAEPLKLVTIGRLAPEKRIIDVIEAVARLHRHRISCTLHIFGEGPSRPALEARVQQLELENFVTFAGVASHQFVMDKLTRSDILIHAAETEPFGLAIIEAMASCLPVVAAESSGAKEIVIHGHTGFLYPVGNVTRLVDHLLMLSQDRILRTSMAKEGRQRAETKFSLNAHIKKMDEVWRAAIEQHEKSRLCHS